MESFNFSKELVPTTGAVTARMHPQHGCFPRIEQPTILGQNPCKRYLRHADIPLLRNLLDALDNFVCTICVFCCVSRNKPTADFSWLLLESRRTATLTSLCHPDESWLQQGE